MFKHGSVSLGSDLPTAKVQLLESCVRWNITTICSGYTNLRGKLIFLTKLWKNEYLIKKKKKKRQNTFKLVLATEKLFTLSCCSVPAWEKLFSITTMTRKLNRQERFQGIIVHKRDWGAFLQKVSSLQVKGIITEMPEQPTYASRSKAQWECSGSWQKWPAFKP